MSFKADGGGGFVGMKAVNKRSQYSTFQKTSP